MSFQIGQKVSVKGNSGVVKFIGHTQFAPGPWVGIELDSVIGKNDGSVSGVRYFECDKVGEYGVFVRHSVPVLLEGDVAFSLNVSGIDDPIGLPIGGKLGSVSSIGERRSYRGMSSMSERASARAIIMERRRPISGQADRKEPESVIMPPVKPSSKRRTISGPEIFQQDSLAALNSFRSRSISRSLNRAKELPLARPTSGQELSRPISAVRERRIRPQSSREFSHNAGAVSTAISDTRLHNIIAKLQTKLHQTTADLDSLNAKINSLTSENSKLANDNTTISAKLETVQKEHAVIKEEHESLQLQLAELQVQYEELKLEYSETKLDYDSLKEEVQLDRELEDELIAQGDIEALTKRNARLETALVKMEEMNESRQIEASLEIQELQEKMKQYDDLKSLYDNTSVQLKDSESLISELRDRLENTGEVEKVIDTLTEKNLGLSERVAELEKTIGELEQLQELDKDLEETHLEVENELRNDIRTLEGIIDEDRGFINELERKNKFLEVQLVRINEAKELQDISIIENERSMIEINQDELTSKIQDLKHRLAKSHSKNTSNVISCKMATIELQQTIEKLELILKISPTIPQYKLDAIDHTTRTNILASYTRILTSKSKSNVKNSSTIFSHLESLLISLSTKIIHDANFPYITYEPVLKTTESEILTALEVFKNEDMPNYSAFEQTYSTLEGLWQNCKMFHNREKLIVDLKKLETDVKAVLDTTRVVQELLSPNEGEEGFAPLLQQLEDLEQAADKLAKGVEHKLEVTVGIRIRGADVEEVEFDGSVNSILRKVSEMSEVLENESVVGIMDCEIVNEAIQGLDVFVLEMKDLLTKIDLICVTPVDVSAKEIWERDIIESSEDPHAREMEVMKEKMVMWAFKFKEKDRMIEELNLKITMLQQKLATNEIKEEEMTELQNRIEDLLTENMVNKSRFKELQEVYEENETKLQQLNNANNVLGNFDDIYEQKQFSSKASLISEIYLLRSIVKSGSLDYEEKNPWLKENIFTISTRSLHVNSKTNDFRKCSNRLRKFASSLKIVPIKNQMVEREWRPRNLIPRFYVTSLKEEFGNYSMERNKLVA